MHSIFDENVTLRNTFESVSDWETLCRHISTDCFAVDCAIEYLKYSGEYTCNGMRILRSTSLPEIRDKMAVTYANYVVNGVQIFYRIV